jgi:exopolysaccharide biosynthesis polyprenyl glycosylphosphotransferase
MDIEAERPWIRRIEPTTVALYDSVKRAFDILCSGLGLLALSPVLGLCALAVRLDSAGPILYRQQRVGLGGQVFDMLKFRSMYANADSRVHQQYVEGYITSRRQEAADQPSDATVASPEVSANGGLFKLVNDPRVTRVGSLLRKTSLDELPQIWNVLRGDMSLVGPRPPIPYEVDMYRGRDFQRLAVKPGITGLWQVSGRNTTTFERMVELDLEYIRTRSLALDLLILLKTVPVVLFAKDAC